MSVDIATPQPCAERSSGVEERDRSRPATAIPARPASERQGESPPLAQLADVEFTPRLETDDEEEERHQAAVHPATQIECDARDPSVIERVFDQSDS